MVGDDQKLQDRADRRRRRVVIVAGVLALGLAIAFGRTAVVQFAQNKAQQGLRTDDLQQAMGWLEWASRVDESNGETLFLLARTYRRLGQLDLASSYLERALQNGLEPHRVERERWLLQAQVGLMAEAETHLAVLLNYPQGDEREISAAFFEGYRIAGRLQRAAEILDAWQADFPQDPLPRFLRGVLWRQTGFFDRAESEFRIATELRAGYPPAVLAIGEMLLDRQQFKQALHCYRSCIDQDPSSKQARTGAAKCLRFLGQLDEARIELTSIAEPESSVEVLVEWGCLEIAQGNYVAAANWLKQAHEKAPNAIEVRQQLAMALAGCGQKEEAQRHFSFVELAQRNQSRVTECKALVDADPKNTELRLEMASLLLEIGAGDEALLWLYEALQVDPNLADAHRTLATYFEQRQSANPMYAALARQHRTKSMEAPRSQEPIP